MVSSLKTLNSLSYPPSMKTKPKVIREIEKIFGFPLIETPENELGKPSFYTVSLRGYSRSYINSPAFPYKGRRGYSVDGTNHITGLALDFCPVFRVRLILWGLSKKFMKSEEKKFSINNASLVSSKEFYF